MFTQPLLSGILLFFGGLGSMMGRVVRRERKLDNISNEQYLYMKTLKDKTLKAKFQKERVNLFHFFQKNPPKFHKINKRNLVQLSKKYFAQVYKKNNPGIWNKIDHAVNFVMGHKKMINDVLTTYKAKNG